MVPEMSEVELVQSNWTANVLTAGCVAFVVAYWSSSTAVKSDAFIPQVFESTATLSEPPAKSAPGVKLDPAGGVKLNEPPFVPSVKVAQMPPAGEHVVITFFMVNTVAFPEARSVIVTMAWVRGATAVDAWT